MTRDDRIAAYTDGAVLHGLRLDIRMHPDEAAQLVDLEDAITAAEDAKRAFLQQLLEQSVVSRVRTKGLP